MRNNPFKSLDEKKYKIFDRMMWGGIILVSLMSGLFGANVYFNREARSDLQKMNSYLEINREYTETTKRYNRELLKMQKHTRAYQEDPSLVEDRILQDGCRLRILEKQVSKFTDVLESLDRTRGLAFDYKTKGFPAFQFYFGGKEDLERESIDLSICDQKP